MTALPPDPDPVNDPDLEPGGGVRPGSTPPDSGSATSGLAHREKDTPRQMGPIVIGVVLTVAVMVGLLLIALGTGWLR